MDNPLRGEQGLRAVNGVEYAAQAMAVLGGLLARQSDARAGFLVAIKDFCSSVAFLDEIQSPLLVDVRLLLQDTSAMIGAFRIGASDCELITGRVTVMLGDEI